jgi:hypothetical protein
MPLQVEIRINGNMLKTLHIGRMEGTTDHDSVNTYAATLRLPGGQPDWYNPDASTFYHRYGDGLEVCVSKALDSILGKKDPLELIEAEEERSGLGFIQYSKLKEILEDGGM